MLLFSSGFGVLAEAGTKTEKYSWLLFLNKPIQPPNQPPVIDPNVDKIIVWLTNSVQLDVTVTSSPNDALVYEWTQLSGPGVVTFSNRFAVDTTATFPVYGETYVLQLSVSDGELTSTVEVTIPFNFLANHTNPEQAKVPADGMYPFGQRMWLSMYSDNSGQLDRMHNAGMTLSGPHYHGCTGPQYSGYDWPKNIAKADKYNMKMFWRLYVGSGGWSGIVEKMRTQTGRDLLRGKIERCIDAVLDNEQNNRVVAAWYGHEEEPFSRSSLSNRLVCDEDENGDENGCIKEQREYLRFVRDIIVGKDPKKRPYFVNERTDSDESNMTGNAAYTAGIMKQNYLMKSNAYDYQGNDMSERFLIGQWVRDQLKAAKINDDKGISYTGKIRPVIATLSMYGDPDDSSLQNETWLRKAITHDLYLSFAMGAHGVNTYTWAANFSTKETQSDLYLEIIGQFTNAELGKVFLWGDKRGDISMQITNGPETFTWNKYSTTYTEQSIKLRNIQYGDNRYILLVNSAKEAVSVKLSDFPKGLRILDIIPNKWNDLGASVTLTIQPLGVHMYKIEQK